jgi:hypothetical protein
VRLEETTVAAVAHHARTHCLAPGRAAVDAPLGSAGRYGRLFDLPPLVADEQALRRIGAAGGFCDGGTGRATRPLRRAGRSSGSTSLTI